MFYCSLPEAEDFSVVISAYLANIVKRGFLEQNWPKAKVVKLSATMIAVYNKVFSFLSFVSVCC